MPVTPAANRGLPAARDSLAMADYLKASQPTCDKIRDGLAIFAIFIIFHYVVRSICAFFAKKNQISNNNNNNNNNTHLPSGLQLDRPRLPWSMDEKTHSGRIFHSMTKNRETAHKALLGPGNKARLSIDPILASGSSSSSSSKAEGVGGHFLTRLPPAPPLTPPELSPTVFKIGPSQQLHAIDSFIHQPNPDYTSSITRSETAQAEQEGSEASTTTPRRRSYHKTRPLGIPIVQSPFKADADSDSGPGLFSPSSYPPSSPLLPPPPPSATDSVDDILALAQAQDRELDVKGEIISALDNDGAGWTRHTRVYGGGICLACASSGSCGGGFYGATVTPEEMLQDAYTARCKNIFVQS